MKNSNIKSAFFLASTLFFLCGFNTPISDEKYPPCISRTVTSNELGQEVVKTEILIDKSTSREALIHTCRFLANEKIDLTFETLKISRPILAFLGQSRITEAKGQIQLPNGFYETFQIGGTLGFNYLKITFSENKDKEAFYFNMVEMVD